VSNYIFFYDLEI